MKELISVARSLKEDVERSASFPPNRIACGLPKACTITCRLPSRRMRSTGLLRPPGPKQKRWFMSVLKLGHQDSCKKPPPHSSLIPASSVPRITSPPPQSVDPASYNETGTYPSAQHPQSPYHPIPVPTDSSTDSRPPVHSQVAPHPTFTRPCPSLSLSAMRRSPPCQSSELGS